MIYITIQGDTWDLIAYKLYGSESYMVQLMQANPSYMPMTIFSAGIVLQVPTVTEPIDTTLPPWKQVQP
ncbi:MAG: tail protein X [Candidatus Pristimantibacillus sp.]